MAAKRDLIAVEEERPLKRSHLAGPVVWWVRNDLRLEDNPVARLAVGEAFADGRACTPVFVFDPRFIDVSPYGRVTDPDFKKSIKTRRPISFSARKTCALRARFWLQSVRALQKDLASQGSGLTVCLGKPEEVLSSLPSGSEVLCQAEPVSIEQTDVEDFVEQALKKSGGALRREWGAMSLYQRGDLPFRIKDQMPGSYSGLGTALGWKDIWTNTEQWEGATPVRAPVAAPARFPARPAGGLTLPGAIPEAVLADDAAALRHLGYSAEEIAHAMKAQLPAGGESAARAHFQTWLAEKADSDGGRAKMAASWDLPVSETADKDGHDALQWANLSQPDGWCNISHYLAVGCISAREMFSRASEHKNFTGVAHRLMWREFHRLNAIHWHRRIAWLQGPGRVERPWTTDPVIVAAWKQGKTGVPYIDACMRELHETGWLAYKGRKTAGFFLVFDLGVDWRVGAFHYEDELLDYDFAMNYGNWVTVAKVDKPRNWGEGEVNPEEKHDEMRWKLSAEKTNDPTGAYIRKWVPELRSVEDRFIHTPWEMKEEDMATCGCTIGKDYPASIVGALDLNISNPSSDAHPFAAEREEAKGEAIA